jgi:integrase/recombinase XerC
MGYGSKRPARIPSRSGLIFISKFKESNVTLADAVNTFQAGYFSTCTRSQKTECAYRIDLAQFGAYIGPGAEIEAISPERMEAWANQMRSEGYASVSIRRKFATARVFFTYWVRRGILEKSPLWRIRLDLGRGQVLPRSLTPPDAKLLIEELWRNNAGSKRGDNVAGRRTLLHARNIAAIEILFATGMRVGELVKLDIADWCESDRAFVVKGKGSRQRLAFLPDDRSFRAVQHYLNRRTELMLPHAGLLINAKGGRLSTQGVARMLTETARTAGVSSKVTPHVIRHTVATLLLRYGADIRVVQEVLGHASIATTQRYTHVSKEHLVSALRARHPNHHLNVRISAA